MSKGEHYYKLETLKKKKRGKEKRKVKRVRKSEKKREKNKKLINERLYEKIK